MVLHHSLVDAERIPPIRHRVKHVRRGRYDPVSGVIANLEVRPCKPRYLSGIARTAKATDHRDATARGCFHYVSTGTENIGWLFPLACSFKDHPSIGVVNAAPCNILVLLKKRMLGPDAGNEPFISCRDPEASLHRTPVSHFAHVRIGASVR
jgi:hypothetical protein